jgi:hypothetical protein
VKTRPERDPRRSANTVWTCLPAGYGFLLGFNPECPGFTLKIALAVGAKWFYKILHLILCTGFLVSFM